MELIDSIIGPDSGQIEWWQMGLRGMLVFILAIWLVRYGDRRIFGRSSAFDIVLGIILGSILSRAITGNSPFWETIFTTLVLVGLHWLFAFTAYRFHRFGRFLKGREVQLIKDGELLYQQMARYNVTIKDICEAGRLNRIENLEDIKDAFLERSGIISLIAFEKEPLRAQIKQAYVPKD